MNIKDLLIDSVLSSDTLRMLRLGMEEPKPPEKIVETIEEPENPPEPITLDKLRDLNDELGVIYTCFKDNHNPEFEGRTKFPKSYNTLSPKEKILLLYAENLRRQFKEKYPKRRPLVLACYNECKVQKFVCTTIRPTVFMFSELIDAWENCAKFIADHIQYEPLPKPISIPTRLLSPETVLKRRCGNSLEMATLLCSFLIGSGFPAMVVSGYATREVTTNDQTRVVCPFIPKDEEKLVEKEISDPKYALKDAPDLRSKFLLDLERKQQEKENAALKEIEDLKQKEIDDLERLSKDKFEGFRSHAWVAIIKNAAWCYKPEFKMHPHTEDEDEVQEPGAFFIEPSTGFRHELNNNCYLGIESMWNNKNYYINRQCPETPISEMKWDLSKTSMWEHFLPGEPFELRKVHEPDESEEQPTEEETLMLEKHLDMPFSWVDQLFISATDFEERYPKGEKKVFYKRACLEKFAPYKNPDGLMQKITLFTTLDYQEQTMSWEWFEHRSDLLAMMRKDYISHEIEEQFLRGRSDSLKNCSYFTTGERETTMQFYAISRFDALNKVVFHPFFLEEHFEMRNDLLYYRKFIIKDKKDPNSILPKSLSQIVEKFHRNEEIVAVRDIATREFKMNDNKIFLLFHYADGCITESSKEFIKPPKSEMGEEVFFDPDSVKGFVSNPWEKQLTGLELYMMLQSQLQDEDKSVDAFHARNSEVEEILRNRSQQTLDPILKFSIFDPLRNESARKLRLQRFEQMKQREELAKKQQADFLAPYLVRYEDKKRIEQKDLDTAREDCLNDFQQNFEEMVNELQKRYDESTMEINALKRFLHRYMEKFTVEEYDKFTVEGENIERHRKIIQQRIEHVNQEARIKFKKLEEAFKSDPRLVAKPPTLTFEEPLNN